jgi:hypothetical protein
MKVVSTKKSRSFHGCYQHVEFRLVYFKAIHLTVFEREAPNELTRRKESLSVLPQARVAYQLSMVGDPRADRPLWYMHMEPPPNHCLGFGQGMAAVEG